ncbi:hypothetical protein [Actinomadura litoris]|uniref:Tetratricopeptide repeat protein n=1 Tax=Actinomadura litoris TaxID=2678616 RepID=A0A7K1KSR5_9ACTN|nr:hypothetical protein [Actinomadura litoris]MUN35230.1 hypothetical protein [Actinomadura litoris]
MLGRALGTRRLRRAVHNASADHDPAGALAALREVRAEVSGALADVDEAVLAELVGTTVRPALLPLLVEADFHELERVVFQVVRASAERHEPSGVWRPVLAARDARQEYVAARGFLMRVYPILDPQDPAKQEVATALARRSALPGETEAPETELSIYVDALTRAPTFMREIIDVVASVLRVDLESGERRMEQAAELALDLSNRRIEAPGLDAALGLAHLIVLDRPDTAITHLTRARDAGRNDEAFRTMLTAAYLRAGDRAAAEALGGHAAATSSRWAREIAVLLWTLTWLDDPASEEAPPVGAAALRDFVIGRLTGPWLGYAAGRMFLLEGDQRSAASLLMPLVAADPVRAEWIYHAAWACLLTGDREGVARCFDRVRGQPLEWAVACLCLDADPESDRAEEIAGVVRDAPPPFTALAGVRAGMARGGGARAEPEPDEEPPWNPDEGVLPERLEAFRTVMARHVGRKDDRLAQLVALPLFVRLPGQERLLWSGLALRATEPDQGRELLDQAARTYGYGRAALVLAAWDAGLNRPGTALELLGDGAPRAGVKAASLAAWAMARDGRDAEASELLRELKDRGQHQAGFMLGQLRMRAALARHAAGDAAEARRIAAEAASELAEAVATVPAATSEIVRLLGGAAAAFAGTGGREAPIPQPSMQAHPWAVWILGIAAATRDPAGADLGLLEYLVILLDRDERLGPEPYLDLARALALACHRGRDRARTGALVELLGRLAARARGRDDLAEVVALHDRAVLGHAQRESDESAPSLPAAPGSVAVAIVQAARALHGGDPAEAARLLREAGGGDAADAWICVVLAGAVEGTPVADAAAEPPLDELSARARMAVHLARAASLSVDEPDRCLEQVAALLSSPGAEAVSRLVDIDRVLPMLCAAKGAPKGGARRGSSPLAEFVERLAETPGVRFDPVVLARCATATGALDAADRLWRRALSAEPDPPAPLREEFARLLCHRAQRARQNGSPLDAAGLLRQAGQVLSSGPIPEGTPA